MIRKLALVSAVALAAFGVSGCFSQAAKDAPPAAALRCHVLEGQGAGTSFVTDKATAVAQGFDTSDQIFCDVA